MMSDPVYLDSNFEHTKYMCRKSEHLRMVDYIYPKNIEYKRNWKRYSLNSTKFLLDKGNEYPLSNSNQHHNHQCMD